MTAGHDGHVVPSDVNHSVVMVTKSLATRHSAALPWRHPSEEIPSAMFVTCCLGDDSFGNVSLYPIRSETDKISGISSVFVRVAGTVRKLHIMCSGNGHIRFLADRKPADLIGVRETRPVPETFLNTFSDVVTSTFRMINDLPAHCG